MVVAAFATRAKGAESSISPRTLGLRRRNDKVGSQEVSISLGAMRTPCLRNSTVVSFRQEQAALWLCHLHGSPWEAATPLAGIACS